jgi:hypothetical protein
MGGQAKTRFDFPGIAVAFSTMGSRRKKKGSRGRDAPKSIDKKANIPSASVGPHEVWTKPILGLLGLLVLSLALGRIGASQEASHGRDFYQFWAVPQVVAEGEFDNIYSEQARQQMGSRFYAKSKEAFDRVKAQYDGDMSDPERKKQVILAKLRLDTAHFRKVFTNSGTPFFFSVFHLFISGDYPRDLNTYLRLSFVISLLATIILAREFGYKVAATLTALALIVSSFSPILTDLLVGNSNQLQLGFLTITIWLLGHKEAKFWNYLTGFVVALTVLFKPNLALAGMLLWLLWLINRQLGVLLRASIGAASGALVALLWSSLFFGTWRCWTQWLSFLSNLLDTPFTVIRGNFSLSNFILEWTDRDISLGLTIALVTMTVIMIWLTRTKGEPDSPAGSSRMLYYREVLVLGAGCTIPMIGSPLAWFHYLVLLVPSLLFVLRPVELGASAPRGGLIGRRIMAWTSFALVAKRPLAMIVSFLGYRYTEKASFTICIGSVLLYALILWELYLAKADPPPAD